MVWFNVAYGPEIYFVTVPSLILKVTEWRPVGTDAAVGNACVIPLIRRREKRKSQVYRVPGSSISFNLGTGHRQARTAYGPMLRAGPGARRRRGGDGEWPGEDAGSCVVVREGGPRQGLWGPRGALCQAGPWGQRPGAGVEWGKGGVESQGPKWGKGHEDCEGKGQITVLVWFYSESYCGKLKSFEQKILGFKLNFKWTSLADLSGTDHRERIRPDWSSVVCMLARVYLHMCSRVITVLRHDSKGLWPKFLKSG